VISSPTTISPDEVARHYDELDYFYRQVWGTHVHHGFWQSEADFTPVEEATIHLLKEVTTGLQLQAGMQVLDIGCGYGASARWVAEQHEVRVQGITISPHQVEASKQASAPSQGQAEVILGDWLDNNFPDNSFDASYAIEALAHMPDKARFFSELHRTLKPGGRASIACWLTAPDLSPLEKLLMGMICREGKLSSMGTMEEYKTLAQEAGLEVREARDLSRQVERTWWIISKRVVRGLCSDPRYLRFLLQRAFRDRLFVLTLPRLLLAYRTGAMRYGLLRIRKPL
jgi:tocopherol O-methyltransferase